MYSIVMLAAMSAAPETPDFCCLKKGNQADNGCIGYNQQYYCCGNGQGGYGGGYGGKGCGFFGCCNRGGNGYGQGGCNFLGCGLFSKCFGGCNFLGCGLFNKCGGGGYNQPGRGYCNTCGGYGNSHANVIAGYGNTPTTFEAEVVVLMPANAKLIANGQAVEGAGSQRAFQTPAITIGQDFRYEMKIVVGDDGETKTLTKQVVVRAGHRTTVDFIERANSAVTVQLPANAKLTVDGTETGVKGGTHTFNTPALEKGQPFSYKFRAEIEKDGKMEVVTQDVSFKAGEPVTVDFTKTTTVSK